MTPAASDDPGAPGFEGGESAQPDLGRAIGGALLEFAEDAVVLVDDRGLIRLWNQSAERPVGYRADEVAGRPVHELIALPEQRARAHKAFGRFGSGGQGPAIGRTVALQAIDREGRPVSIELSLSSLEVGGRWYGIGIARDIRERLRQEAEIRRARDWMERVLDAAGSRAGALVGALGAVDPGAHRERHRR